jgi:hypothetical protein
VIGSRRVLMLARTTTAATVVALAVAGSLATFGREAVHWIVRGEAIVTCPCKIPCPCRSNARPSQPHCENLSYVRVVEGHYGTTRLDRLEYAWAADECTGPSHPRQPTSLYFPATATPDQIAAIESIMTGEHCSTPAIASEMKAKRVALTADASGSVYSVRVPSMLRLDVDLAPGPVTMEPLPALDAWGNTVTYAHSITARVDDPQAGLKWDYSGLQANYRTFEATSELAERGLLLAMFRDDSGHFNQAQRALIQELHLQVPLSPDEFQRMLVQVREPAKDRPKNTRGDSSGAIAGTVFAADGKPRSGARIRTTGTNLATVPVAVSNPSGQYFLARVPAGTYDVCAFSWDGQTAEKTCLPVAVKRGTVVHQDLALTVASGS